MYTDNLNAVATRSYAYQRWKDAIQKTESVANRVAKLESAVGVSGGEEGEDGETTPVTTVVTASSVTTDALTLTKQGEDHEETDVRAKLESLDQALAGKAVAFTVNEPLLLEKKENSDDTVLSVATDDEVTAGSPKFATSGAIASAIEAASGLGAGVKSVGASLDVNADTGALNVGSSVVTAVKVGATTVVPEGRSDGNAGGVVTIPTASTTGEGTVKIKSGGGLQATGGEVSVDSQVVTQLTLGGKVVSPTARGGGAAGGTVAVPYASATAAGVVKVGKGLSVSDGTLSTDPTGTISGIRAGVDSADAILPDSDGKVTIPAATTKSYGVVKVGSGLATALDGSLEADGSAVVKDIRVYKGTEAIKRTDGEDGVIELPAATTKSYGVVKVGAGLAVNDGTVGISSNVVTGAAVQSVGGINLQSIAMSSNSTGAYLRIPCASDSTCGVVRIGTGTGLEVNSNTGVLSINTTVLKSLLGIS